MADSISPPERERSSRPTIKTKNVRSQKIITLSPSDTRQQDIPEESEPLRERGHHRSQTPGHMSSKSQDKKKKASELALRQRSQSLSQKELSSPKSSSKSSSHGRSTPRPENPVSPPTTSTSAVPARSTEVPNPTTRPLNNRSTSAIAPKHTPPSATSSPALANQAYFTGQIARSVNIPFPSLPSSKAPPDVEPAPASGMYWSRAPISGTAPISLRAHTTTLVGSSIYIFGGCDSRACFNELYVLDADAFYFSTPYVCGTIPVPLRAMTCTAVGKKLVVFGGGDGPAYFNDVYVLDTVNYRWSTPVVAGDGRAGDRYPSKRRAHTACFFRNGIYVFGGGDGVRALNDVWRLDVADTNKMSWKLISPPGEGDDKPKARGYHTANMVGSKLIIFGGSDGGECFGDVWIFDAATGLFSPVLIPPSACFPRLSHTATIVGSYLFVVGGHDGVEYSNEVLQLNLVTMVWDKRKVNGNKLKSRGYHGTVLHDSRLVVVGGFDGATVFGDVWILELAVHAYYSQISHFSIDV